MHAKPWYQSTTYHGLIVMIVGIVLGYLGFNGEDVGMVKSELLEILGLAGNVIATIMIAHGRNVASTVVTLTKKGATKHNEQFDPTKLPE